jgi:hypothetical protein
MKSYSVCPVSDKMINERVARLNGFFTVFLLAIFALTQNIIPVGFLAIDFFLRAFGYSTYSLIGISSENIVKYFGFNDIRINAGPKIFAARIGFVISSLIVIFFVLHLYLAVLTLGVVLGAFSFLEATFGLCVACEIYPFVYRFLYRVKYQ